MTEIRIWSWQLSLVLQAIIQVAGLHPKSAGQAEQSLEIVSFRPPALFNFLNPINRQTCFRCQCSLAETTITPCLAQSYGERRQGWTGRRVIFR